MPVNRTALGRGLVFRAVRKTTDRIEGYYRNHHISKEYRAKLAGWYDGGFAGDLARLADSFRSLRIEKEGGKTGQE